MTDMRFLPAGDTALVIEFGDTVERSLGERVLALSDRVRRAAVPGHRRWCSSPRHPGRRESGDPGWSAMVLRRRTIPGLAALGRDDG